MMEEWEEGTGGEKKKDFFCQIQSGIHYPSRAAVGARFNLQAIFLESVCILSVCGMLLCSLLGQAFHPSEQHTTHSLCSRSFASLLYAFYLTNAKTHTYTLIHSAAFQLLILHLHIFSHSLLKTVHLVE